MDAAIVPIYWSCCEELMMQCIDRDEAENMAKGSGRGLFTLITPPFLANPLPLGRARSSRAL